VRALKCTSTDFSIQVNGVGDPFDDTYCHGFRPKNLHLWLNAKSDKRSAVIHCKIPLGQREESPTMCSGLSRVEARILFGAFVLALWQTDVIQSADFGRWDLGSSISLN
jgi:hypothetical protein